MQKRGNPDIESGSVPEIYDELLVYYVELLSQAEFNPYQSSVMLSLKGLNPLYQLRVWRLTLDFYKVPNMLKYSLIGASDMLSRLQALDINTLESVIIMNELNLKRLQNGSIFNWFNKLSIGIGGFLGLLAAIETMTRLNIEGTIPPYAKEVLVEFLIGMVIGGVINIFVFHPKIKLVQALNDILKIAKAYQIKEGDAAASHT